MREDWIEIELGEVSELNPRIINKNKIDGELEVQFLPMKLVEEVSNKIHLDEIRKFKEVQKKSYTYFSEGDVLFAKVTPCMENGKIAVANDLKNGIGFGSSEFHVFRCSEILLNKYLFYFLVQEKFRRNAQHEMTGAVGLRRVPKNYLLHHTIALPPLPIQRAIVSKIEALFSDLDNGIADLKKAQEQLKIYRQAVLKKAFEGGFTKNWCKANQYQMDSFLINLKKEKTDAIKSKLIAKGDYFPVFSAKDLIFNIPINWIYLPWKTITSNNKYAMKRGPFGSALKKEFFVEKGVVVYEQGHAINDDPYRHRYYISDNKFEELNAFEVKGGDMIISCSGVTLGRICLLPEDAEKGVINQALLKIDLDEKIMLKKYFVMLFRSEIFQRMIFGKSLGTAMPNMVGMAELKEIPIPVPSIKEQHQIIREIESRLSVCDKVEESINEALTKSEALRQSILKKAFEGKLLSPAEIEKCKQAKDYEPAGVLLEKIRCGRDAMPCVSTKNKNQ